MIHDLWQLFNLRDTPFFQEALQPGEAARYSVEWFIGRESEADRLRRTILGHAGSSRQTVRGTIGVGKSTLVQYVKAHLAGEGLYSTPDAVALGHADGTDEVAIRILSYVYETLVGVARERDALLPLEKDEAVQEVRQLVRAFRETTGVSGGVSVSLLGGVSGGRSTTRVTPGTARPAVLVGECLRALMRAARTHLGARGIIVHVNNLENLTEHDATRAGAVFRDLRDPCLLADGYHWVVVGTTDALRAVVDAHPQLRTVFSLTLVLEPLSEDELLRLLDRRYQALAADPVKPARPPVTAEAVRTLYRLFRGDLRGTLAALDEAAHGLLGYGTHGPDAPLTVEDVHPFLAHRYAADLRARLTPNQADALTTLATRLTAPTFTIKDAATLWQADRSWASRMLADLQHAGYVIALEERLPSVPRGRPAATYTMSGGALLAVASP